MRTEAAISLLERVIHFTREHNVAKKSDLKEVALVVTYNALERHLNANMSEKYAEMVDEFGELFSFLMNQGRAIANRDLGTKWKYSVMRGSVYCENVDRRKQRFPPLIEPYFRSFNLFVLFQEPQARQYHGTKEEYYGLTERLTNEIQACYEENSLPDEDYVIREEIVKNFTEKFQEIFNEQELSVELIGSSHTKLALSNRFISMGIRLPQSCFREDALLCDDMNWKETVYDVHYMAKCLRELGMEATLPIPQGKRTKFTHAISRTPCSIGVDDSLLFERDLLISEYIKLDKRIKPLMVVILYFTKLQKVNKGNYEACTIWNSENVDSMGVLFINFMEYCAQSENYRDVSIVNSGQDYAGFKESEVSKADAWIQDPFVLQKNIARACKFYTLKNITRTFNSATVKLKQGKSLQDICDMDTYINKN
ncbi:hypothetical protein MFLAVUS_000683 [Mucor flavus]|uniref:Uncharacterized protein n=1 Tax=Mucor flavus TaxID=439312 RepID=A0ABP9YKD5_9FUNG